jgi:hypothetical protein
LQTNNYRGLFPGKLSDGFIAIDAQHVRQIAHVAGDQGFRQSFGDRDLREMIIDWAGRTVHR